jgi:lipopolysaccharide assembly protein A
MRWIYLAILILFAVATIVFIVQNLDSATMTFFGFRVQAPLALLAAAAYALGAVTGGSLFALLHRSVKGAGPQRAPA